MTSQVAVFNLECVAVASDSVVTVTNGSAQRTLASSEKMHDLGDAHRVVVLSSGATVFMGIPLSVLLGEWAAGLTEPFDSRKAYAADFVAWLQGRKNLFGKEVQEAHFSWQLRDYYGMIRRQVLEALEEEGASDLAWDDLTVQGIVNRVVEEGVDALRERSDLSGLNTRADRSFLTSHRSLVEAALESSMDGVPTTVTAQRLLVGELPWLVLTKDEPWSLDACLAFIGYGAADLFPGHQAITLHGMVRNQVRMDWWNPAEVTTLRPSLVAPFGQAEAIDTFLRAYNAEFLSLAHKRLDHILEKADLPEVFTAEDGGVEGVARLVHEGLDEDVERLSRTMFIEPMLDTVEALPRADMARMAEALVGVQALRAASMRRQPTVGGPIDVVVICRRHGVQWVRRKELTLE